MQKFFQTFIGRALLLAFSVFFITRIVLVFLTGVHEFDAKAVTHAIALGFWFDAVVLLYILTPVAVIGALFTDQYLQRHKTFSKQKVLFFLFSIVLVFVFVAEIVFWNEFSARFNFISVDYLLYTHEVFDNIKQSYSLNWILTGVVLSAALLTAFIYRKRPSASVHHKQRAIIALVFVVLLLVVNKHSRIEQMEFSENAYANELSGNGMFTFFSALRRNELDYEKFYATIPQLEADQILKKLNVERQPLSEFIEGKRPDLKPEVLDHLPLVKRPKNIVLISVESLSASFVEAFGGTPGLTPRLNQLATESLTYDHFFATGTRTVRGLEALSLGIPPIPGQAIVRRPQNQHLSTLGEILSRQGVAVSFVYGGYGYFDNMNTYFTGNDYRVIDRSQFPQNTIPFENVWGVADEALFDNVLTALDDASKSKKRFFTHIMTTSNHRPYTYPNGRIDIPSPGGRDGAVKYTDYAIGRFIDMAKTKSWFNDTLFIITADHCASVAGKAKIPVYEYRIPLILYAPKLIKPGVRHELVSQLDIPPTVLEFMGFEGDDYFFGQSLFEADRITQRAFVSNYQSLGYYKNGILTVLSPKRSVETYLIDPVSFEPTRVDVHEDLLKEAIAYYQTASKTYKYDFFKMESIRASAELPNLKPKPKE